MRWALASLAVVGFTGAASADPDKDGKGRERGGHAIYADAVPGFGPEREDAWDSSYSSDRPRRASREFKEEYDDGVCKTERKLEKDGEYKEETKCRDGRKSSYKYRY